MSSSRNSLKRRCNETTSSAESEKKVALTNVVSNQNTTRNVMQQLLTQGQLIEAARSTNYYEEQVKNAFTVLTSYEIPLTDPIVNLVCDFPEAAFSICDLLVDLQNAKIEMTDAVITSLINPKREMVVSHLQALHEAKIQLLDIAVRGLSLAVKLNVQKDYFLAMQLLSIHDAMCDKSIQKLNQYLCRIRNAMQRFEETDLGEEGDEDFVGIAKKIIETENELFANKFNDFINNPEESRVLPFPTALSQLVHSFFATPLIRAEIDFENIYPRRLAILAIST